MSTIHDAALAAPLHSKRAYRYPLGNLRAPGLLGKWPFIGLAMLLIGLSLFGVFAFNLQTKGPLIQTDTQIVNDLHADALQSSPFTQDAVIVGSYLGEQGVLAIGAVLALYFLIKRFWPELSMVVIAWAGEGGIWLVLTQYFNRARPLLGVSFWTRAAGSGFPSGHSFSAVLCFGLLAYLLAPQLPSRFWKVAVTLVAVLIILYIGFSRVYVGDHYPTDVLAGYALGIAWAGLVYTSVELIAKRVKKHKES